MCNCKGINAETGRLTRMCLQWERQHGESIFLAATLLVQNQKSACFPRLEPELDIDLDIQWITKVPEPHNFPLVIC